MAKQGAAVASLSAIAANLMVRVGPGCVCAVIIAMFGGVAPAYGDPDAEPLLRLFVDGQSAYDDNLFRLPTNPTNQRLAQLPGASQDERIDTGTIGMVGRWTGGLQAVDLDLQADYNRFAHNRSLDNAGGNAKLAWDWQVTDRWSGKVGASFDRALASFANNYFLGKDSLTNFGYFGELDWQARAHWFLRATGSRTETTHSASIREIDNYNSYSGALDLLYQDLLGDVFAAEYGYTIGRFPHVVEVDDIPFDRSYHDNSIGLRITYLLGGRTTLRTSTTYLRRTYPNSTIGNFSGITWRAAVEWQAGAKSQIIVSSWRDLTAYVDSQSDYFVTSGVSVTPTWTPSEKLQFSVAVSRERERFIGSNPELLGTDNRRDTVTSAQLASTWTPRTFLTVAISYQLSKRDSNIDGLPYRDNLANLRVRLSR